MLDSYNKIIIRDFALEMSIGIYEHERKKMQPVLINMALDVHRDVNAPLEDIGEVVSYEDIINDIKSLTDKRHYELIERFAEDVISMCFEKYNKITIIDIKIEKTEIIKDVAGVGVHILCSR